MQLYGPVKVPFIFSLRAVFYASILLTGIKVNYHCSAFTQVAYSGSTKDTAVTSVFV